MTLLQIDFPSHGPWGEDLTKRARGLANHLNRTPGMVWKIWTENSRTGDCGGVYLFTDESSANDFLAGCGKTRFEAEAVPRNSLVSTAQPDKKKACVEKTSSSWMCLAT
jgi:hypothetical protein